jgi:PQQ-dependent dehydrogenase (methanol/ethanol family)
VAVDAKTGREVWSTLTIDKDAPYSITGAPRIAKGRVLIGNGGADYGVRGYLSAYDAETGRLDWRFFTVPGNPKNGFENDVMRSAARTWSGEWWTVGGGGTVWDAIVYDPVTDLVYMGVGNGSPWSAEERSPGGGDNLFLSSIVAVRADTGAYVWHYQTTPRESWDYTATQPIMVAEMKIQGQQRRVVMQAPKNGFFYVLDARSGKLLSADAYTELNWADGVDMTTGRPIVRPAARYDVTGKPFNSLPGPQGAHSWHPMAYSPQTNYVYIPVQTAWFPFIHDPNYVPRKNGANLGVDFGAPATFYRDHPGEPNDFSGYLIAWDPIQRKEVWRGERNSGNPGGALATAGGLVFQGGGSSQEFRAYDAGSGEKLWSAQVQTGVLAPPVTFRLNGQQYIAVSVGGEQAGGYYAPNYSRLLLFGLGGKATLPPMQSYAEPPLNPPASTATAESVAAGRERYSQYCAVCHGVEGRSRGAVFPNLTRSPMLHSQEGFNQIVLEGARAKGGMAPFKGILTETDTAELRAYLIARANELKATALKGDSTGGAPTVPKQPHENIEQ